MNLARSKASLRNLGSNKTLITFPNGLELYYSYSTCVCCYSPLTKEFYRTSKKWSRTTTRHINEYLKGCEAVEKSQDYFDNIALSVG